MSDRSLKCQRFKHNDLYRPGGLLQFIVDLTSIDLWLIISEPARARAKISRACALAVLLAWSKFFYSISDGCINLCDMSGMITYTVSLLNERPKFLVCLTWTTRLLMLFTGIRKEPGELVVVHTWTGYPYHSLQGCSMNHFMHNVTDLLSDVIATQSKKYSIPANSIRSRLQWAKTKWGLECLDALAPITNSPTLSVFV